MNSMIHTIKLSKRDALIAKKTADILATLPDYVTKGLTPDESMKLGERIEREVDEELRRIP